MISINLQQKGKYASPIQNEVDLSELEQEVDPPDFDVDEHRVNSLLINTVTLELCF